MRMYLRLTKNTTLIPYDYQPLLAGVVHKWIGADNEIHGKRALFNFSWLKNTYQGNNGINLTNDSCFFISTYDEQLMKKVLKGILNEPEMFSGVKVKEVRTMPVPHFGSEARFMLSSPILIRKREGKHVKHVTFMDSDFDFLLTSNVRSKLRFANLRDDGISVEWDKNYPNPKTKLVTYRGIGNKTSLVPIIVKGEPEQIAFIWAVGLGESTGIGFGSIK